MLLVFDARPNETLTSTMNQVLGESALELWSSFSAGA